MNNKLGQEVFFYNLILIFFTDLSHYFRLIKSTKLHQTNFYIIEF